MTNQLQVESFSFRSLRQRCRQIQRLFREVLCNVTVTKSDFASVQKVGTRTSSYSDVSHFSSAVGNIVAVCAGPATLYGVLPGSLGRNIAALTPRAPPFYLGNINYKIIVGPPVFALRKHLKVRSATGLVFRLGIIALSALGSPETLYSVRHAAGAAVSRIFRYGVEFEF